MPVPPPEQEPALTEPPDVKGTRLGRRRRDVGQEGVIFQQGLNHRAGEAQAPAKFHTLAGAVPCQSHSGNPWGKLETPTKTPAAAANLNLSNRTTRYFGNALFRPRSMFHVKHFSRLEL